MKRHCLILFGALTIGCADSDDSIFDSVDDAPPTEDGDAPPTTHQTWQATLVATDPALPVSGAATAIMFEGDLSFMVAIGVRGDIPGSLRPWHVHIGRCASGGSIVGPTAAYPPLRIGDDGEATLVTNVLVPLDTGAYHVNVHESETDLATLIACGDLIRQSAHQAVR